MIDYPIVTYDSLANEYYDSARHPTCENFRVASKYLLSKYLLVFTQDKLICEVGCGLSEVAEILIDNSTGLENLILMDQSSRMLSYSTKWVDKGASLLQGDAFVLPFLPESLDVIVSSLGDPYNQQKYWEELDRVLKPNGIVLFTTPSYKWKTVFRNNTYQDFAEFELKTKEHVLIRSWIYSEEKQRKMIESTSLRLKEISSVKKSNLELQQISPKLEKVIKQNGDIVTLYVAGKD